MCNQCPWEEVVERCIDLINDDDHRFAFGFDTLSGIKDRIAETHHVTPGQVHAIDNIEAAGKRRRR